MRLTIKSLIHCFKSVNVQPRTNQSISSKYIISQTLFRAFYAVVFFLSIDNLTRWNFYLSKTELEPLWAVSWLQIVNLYWGITFIVWFNLIGGFLAITYSHNRCVRMLIFLSILEFHALTNSFGKIGHGSHLAIFITFLLIFLPQGWHLVNPKNKYIKTATLTIFSACQTMIMLTYTMSGIGKIIYAFVQAIRGEVHALMPKGLALLIANRLLETESSSYLGGWLIEHYYVSWILMIGTIYLQFFGLWAAFRPSLHQIWALGLILFHVSVYLTMTITFEQNCLWLAIFFLYSPFLPPSFRLQQVFLDLPLVDLFFPKKKLFFFLNKKI